VRKDILKLLSSLSVGLGLMAIYIVFLNQFFAVADLSNLSEVESIILYSQILRVLILFIVGLRYQIQPIVPIIVFSIEALLIPPLLVLIILTGSPYYTIFMGVVLTAWFGATALILTPYSIYVHARTLSRETAISSVLALSAIELISVLFLSNLVSTTTQPIQGLSGLGTLIISAIRFDISSGGVPNPSPDLLSTTGLVLFFIGLLFYMSLTNYWIGSKYRLPWMLVVAFAGTIVAFFWLGIGSQFESDILIVLSAPSVALYLLIRGTTREK
jgi:hypothetical protein